MSKQLQKKQVDLTSVVFSDGSARFMARVLRIKPEQTDKFRAAYGVLPLSRLKECIDIAYELALEDCDVDEIKPWIDTYARLSRRALPQWAKKNSQDYLKKTRARLKGNGDFLNTTLFEFKGFIYAVFCRRLIDYYCEVKNGESATGTPNPKPLRQSDV